MSRAGLLRLQLDCTKGMERLPRVEVRVRVRVRVRGVLIHYSDHLPGQ